MVRRYFRLLGLLGILVTVVMVGCRSSRSRPQAATPQPLGQTAQDRKTTPEAPTALAIQDRPPASLPTSPTQLAQKDTKPVATPGPSAVPVTTNGNRSDSPLRNLSRLCAEKNATLDNYVVQMRRREVVNGTKQPEELIMLKFRKEPWSVYFKWLGAVGKGREVVFVNGRYNNQMHIRTGAGDAPFTMTKSFDLNSPMVTSKSRHPITNAGLGNMIARFGNLVDDYERGVPGAGKLEYLKTVQRQDYGAAALECVHQVIPGGREPQLPRGGQRWWFFDMSLRIPVMVITLDDRGQEVEYYVYEQLRLVPGGFAEDDFNPASLGRHR